MLLFLAMLAAFSLLFPCPCISDCALYCARRCFLSRDFHLLVHDRRAECVHHDCSRAAAPPRRKTREPRRKAWISISISPIIVTSGALEMELFLFGYGASRHILLFFSQAIYSKQWLHLKLIDKNVAMYIPMPLAMPFSRL